MSESRRNLESQWGYVTIGWKGDWETLTNNIDPEVMRDVTEGSFGQKGEGSAWEIQPDQSQPSLLHRHQPDQS